MSIEDQVIDLQSRVCFQEDAIQTLNEVIARQAEQLAVAQEHIKLLNNKLNDILAAMDDGSAKANVKPPHF